MEQNKIPEFLGKKGKNSITWKELIRGGFFKNELRYDLTHGVAKSDLGRNSKSVFKQIYVVTWEGS